MERSLQYIIHHVFLPPKLPLQEDSSWERCVDITSSVFDTLKEFELTQPLVEKHIWASMSRMIASLEASIPLEGNMSPDKINSMLITLIDGDVIALHVVSQNAGILIRRIENEYIFESFELSPVTKAVMDATGRLIRCFPGPSIAISRDRILNSKFRAAISQCIAELSNAIVPEAHPTTQKAGSKVMEIRDSIDPKFVTEMLTGILRGIGRTVDTERIHKRTRDDVLWHDAAKPWRRSRRWLLIRVALHTSLAAGDKSLARYKAFMIFFMARVLKYALTKFLPSDTYFIMVAKITRRLLKFGPLDESAPWLLQVHNTVNAAQRELQNRWKSIEQPLYDHQSLDKLLLPVDDSHSFLTINSFKDYVDKVVKRPQIASENHKFTPHCPFRTLQTAASLPSFEDKGETYIWLADTELWVQDHLDQWLQANINSDYICINLLTTTMDKYIKAAELAYENDPESFSIMILTIMELWIALDKCATDHTPLLKEYGAGFRLSLFDPLLLPKNKQMQRLSRIQKYLGSREEAAKFSSALIFEKSNISTSFAVRSVEHKSLRLTIEESARTDRNAKSIELASKKREYQALVDSSNGRSCDTINSARGKKKRRAENSQHSPHCQKCQSSSKAAAMKIAIHEWPLPMVDLEVKAVVFELMPPPSFTRWRDMTYQILVDVFSPDFPRPKPVEQIYTLRNFKGIQTYLQDYSPRLQLASNEKSFSQAHYSQQAVSIASESTICVNNGLRCTMYDDAAGQWTKNLLGQCSIRKACMLELPQGSYKALQFALESTEHTSNDVLSRQADCAESLSLHEFYAFGSLRSGHRLQWRNIARELVTGGLNFSHDATHQLLVQAAWQAGPGSLESVLRESHIDLEEFEFGRSLLLALDDAIDRVESNWQGAPAARAFTLLAARLLSISSHTAVRLGCFQYLEKIRRITLRWTHDVLNLMHESEKESDLNCLSIQALEMALACHSTFDVDLDDLKAILSSTENVSAVTEAMITIHDRCPSFTDTLPSPLRVQLRRFFRLSHRLEGALGSAITLKSDGIDKTVSQLWRGYRPATAWTRLSPPKNRWVTTETSIEKGRSSKAVHLNLLDGTLLVNGLPLTRLPEKYERHDIYRRLFGEKILEVVPSNVDGMIFETCRSIFGHQIHFGMYDEQLIVRTYRDHFIYDHIPPSALLGDFPLEFISDYVHWMKSDGSLEFRPLATPWISSSRNWRTNFSDTGNVTLNRGPLRLVDIRSSLTQSISHVLSPLECKGNIHIMFNILNAVVEIHLPRLNLDFVLQRAGSRLESRQFRGMAVDTNQSFSAFSGLKSKLVLQEINGTSRMVIVPDGRISFKRTRDHLGVSIQSGSSKLIQYHQFQIDGQLGRLVDNGSLLSRLFKIYLHAMTSHCLPDSLTGKSGTEAAFDGLSAASTLSFLELGPREVEILNLISEITPIRVWYPKHLKVMQDVEWSKLPPLSQHEGFNDAVESIMSRARLLSLFHDSPANISEEDPRGFYHLHHRAAIRNASFRTHGFGAEVFSTRGDVIYEARDRVTDTSRELKACTMASMVDAWSPNTQITGDLLSEMESWKPLIDGVNSSTSIDLGFDLEWLNHPSEFFPNRWCTLHKILSASNPQEDKYEIMFFLAGLAYARYANLKLVRTLLAFATIDALRCLPIPDFEEFKLSIGYQPSETMLTELVASHFIPFQSSPEATLTRLPHEKEKAAHKRRNTIFAAKKVKIVKEWVDYTRLQWPATQVVAPENPHTKTYMQVTEALSAIRDLFGSWHRNMQFKTYISNIQTVVESQVAFSTPEIYTVHPTQIEYLSKKTYINFTDLLTNPAPIVLQSLNSIKRLDLPVTQTLSSAIDVKKQSLDTSERSTKLEILLANLSIVSKGGYEKNYIKDLEKSYNAFNLAPAVELDCSFELVSSILEDHLEHCTKCVKDIYQTICFHLQLPSTMAADLARRVWLMPRLSPSIILSHLAQSKSTELKVEWIKAIVGYGLALTALQQAERLVACAGNRADLISELLHPGHVNWSPIDHPEWLLLELENGILIREEQAEIAMQMISPSSGLNSIMQLNMGLGKSSVIVPIVAAALADGKKLARVVVLKSLSTQMFQLLLNKLGGLLNRQVFYLPMSRSLPVNDIQDVQYIQKTLMDCMYKGGILLVQPEHILSFELLGLDRLLSKNSSASNQKIGEEMVNVQQWLHANSRDILDESDEILSVRFELIYTMGLQAAIDYSPNRWVIIQQVLEIVVKSARKVSQTFHNGLEVLPKAGGFARIRILQAAAGNEMLKCAAQEICKTGIPGLPIWNLPHQARSLLFQFITDLNMTEAETAPLQNSALNIGIMANGLLLLRGLFANGILSFAFGQKRWRVNYGLDLSRTKLAVPYYAKDSPSARSEFSHPDTAIILTCLSYYYGGLSDKQLSECFEQLAQSDDAEEKYRDWIRNLPDLPTTFQQLKGINLSNIAQCSREVFPHLRISKGVIDYYMSHIIFPREMKEFPQKLSASGWDLGRDKVHPLTGFSGTNDSKYVLPLRVSQCDLPQQLSTNASVLDCLLRSENSFDESFTSVEVLDAEILLQMTVKSIPPVRVILDVGAQVLELQNVEVAKKWLSMTPPDDAQAVIYFNENNELCVINRTGLKELLHVSPYSKQMDCCLVYLDEAHTRGTDLKMPGDYRAIVTLGPDLTKDRLAQACMRMRKLGKGQSVVFCSAIEVQLKLLAANNKRPGDRIEVSDVLSWCIQNTWANTKKSIPLWATQGIRHYRRRGACSTSDCSFIPGLVLEPEAQTLQQRYGYSGDNSEESLVFNCATKLINYNEELKAIRLKCQEFGLLSFGDSALHEEQERELQPENERERQVERPAPLAPLSHTVHAKVRDFILNGLLDRFSDAFRPAFSSLVHTSAAALIEPLAWPQDLLVTSDFVLTVETGDNQSLDSFLRPVNWIVSGKYGNKVSYVILSPHEANEMMPLVRRDKKVTLHTYAPRLSLAHRNLDDLSFCSIPSVPRSWKTPSLTTQINLFAGQLYLRTPAEFISLCRFLGLCWRPPNDNVRVACDGFINPQDRALVDTVMARNCRFTVSPLSFLRNIMALRRKSHGFASSHMGRLLNGELLKEEYFEKEESFDLDPMEVDSIEVIDLTGD